MHWQTSEFVMRDQKFIIAVNFVHEGRAHLLHEVLFDAVEALSATKGLLLLFVCYKNLHCTTAGQPHAAAMDMYSHATAAGDLLVAVRAMRILFQCQCNGLDGRQL